jgi:hypothetical protein
MERVLNSGAAGSGIPLSEDPRETVWQRTRQRLIWTRLGRQGAGTRGDDGIPYCGPAAVSWASG